MRITFSLAVMLVAFAGSQADEKTAPAPRDKTLPSIEGSYTLVFISDSDGSTMPGFAPARKGVGGAPAAKGGAGGGAKGGMVAGQAELGRRANVSASYIWRLETAGASPGIDLVARLARRFWS
jgi:hypothetical protein